MNFQSKMAQFMYGRNGVDSFGKFTMGVTLILFIATMFSKSAVCYLIGCILLVYSIFRMMSKDVQHRYLENQKYLQIADRIKAPFSHNGSIKELPWKVRAFFTERQRRSAAKKAAKIRKKEQAKIYRFYSCPNCKQKIRVPRNRGKIEISCPKCETKFIKNTGKKPN